MLSRAVTGLQASGKAGIVTGRRNISHTQVKRRCALTCGCCMSVCCSQISVDAPLFRIQCFVSHLSKKCYNNETSLSHVHRRGWPRFC
jgi:hypothetical protein